MHQPSTTFEVRRRTTLSVSALIGRVTLTFDLLTLKLVSIIVRKVGNLPTNFGVSGTFPCRLIGQHLSDEGDRMTG